MALQQLPLHLLHLVGIGAGVYDAFHQGKAGQAIGLEVKDPFSRCHRVNVVLQLTYHFLLHLGVNVKDLSTLRYLLSSKLVALYLKNPCIHKPSRVNLSSPKAKNCLAE